MESRLSYLAGALVKKTRPSLALLMKSFLVYFVLSAIVFSSEIRAQDQQTQKPPHFEQIQIQIADKKISVEKAQSNEQLSYGLMYREKLANDTGMLFVFSQEETRNFWMKNTFVNLSIGFFDRNRKLVDVQEMQAVKTVMEEPRTYKSKFPAKYALEMPAAWFKKNQIKLGDVFNFILEHKTEGKSKALSK